MPASRFVLWFDPSSDAVVATDAAPGSVEPPNMHLAKCEDWLD